MIWLRLARAAAALFALFFGVHAGLSALTLNYAGAVVRIDPTGTAVGVTAIALSVYLFAWK